ncbi:MAG: response regulator [Phycisphaerales bacterium JB065]
MRPHASQPSAEQRRLDRPTLLIVESSGFDAAGVEHVLSERFEVVRASPGEAMDRLRTSDARLILAATGDFLPLERSILMHQSSMMLNAIGEGVCLVDRSGEIVWANDRFQKYQKLIAQDLSVFAKKTLKTFDRQLPCLDDDEPPQPERLSFKAEDEDRYFDCLVTPFLDSKAVENGEKPKVTHLVVALRDITGREQLRSQMDALDRAGREMMHLDADTIKGLHAADRLNLLEKRVHAFARKLLKFDHFAVRLLDEQTGELKLVMSSGMPREATEIKLYSGREDQGISGYVAATGESYVCNDASKDPRYVFGLEQAGSSLTVPVQLYDKRIGVFNVESEHPNAFTDRDRQFAEIFAGYLAMGLHTLNLLLVERYTTREDTSGTMQGELSAPLNDLALEAEYLREQAAENPDLLEHIERILRDVASIRTRVKDVAQGPRSLLGVDEELRARRYDSVLGEKRVLVADNEPQIVETVRDVLRNRGAIVESFGTGEDAIKELQRAATNGEKYDLVVSDINLGEVTGYEIFAAAKKVDESVPVILMTGFGYDPHHSIVRASQEGLQCVLFKPFQAETLVDECRKAIAVPPDVAEKA